MPALNPAPDLAEVFGALRKILAAHSASTVVVHDTADQFYLNTTKLHPKNRQPLCFGFVRTGKNYVSFHLMPVYGCPALLKDISPALRRRMQGKACFNFTAPDQALFTELADLTKRSAIGYAKAGYM